MGRGKVGYEMFFTYVSPENAVTLASLALFVINYTFPKMEVKISY